MSSRHLILPAYQVHRSYGSGKVRLPGEQVLIIPFMHFSSIFVYPTLDSGSSTSFYLFYEWDLWNTEPELKHMADEVPEPYMAPIITTQTPCFDWVLGPIAGGSNEMLGILLSGRFNLGIGPLKFLEY